MHCKWAYTSAWATYCMFVSLLRKASRVKRISSWKIWWRGAKPIAIHVMCLKAYEHPRRSQVPRDIFRLFSFKTSFYFFLMCMTHANGDGWMFCMNCISGLTKILNLNLLFRDFLQLCQQRFVLAERPSIARCGSLLQCLNQMVVSHSFAQCRWVVFARKSVGSILFNLWGTGEWDQTSLTLKLTVWRDFFFKNDFAGRSLAGALYEASFAYLVKFKDWHWLVWAKPLHLKTLWPNKTRAMLRPTRIMLHNLGNCSRLEP